MSRDSDHTKYILAAPCPYCGYRKVEFMQEVEAVAGKEPSAGFFSLCRDCGAQGPRRADVDSVTKAHSELGFLREAVAQVRKAVLPFDCPIIRHAPLDAPSPP